MLYYSRVWKLILNTHHHSSKTRWAIQHTVHLLLPEDLLMNSPHFVMDSSSPFSTSALNIMKIWYCASIKPREHMPAAIQIYFETYHDIPTKEWRNHYINFFWYKWHWFKVTNFKLTSYCFKYKNNMNLKKCWDIKNERSISW